MTSYYLHPNLYGQKLVIRRGMDGKCWWIGEGEQDAGYLDWLAAGNTPEPWNPEQENN